jgi:5-methylcytosine-specific restriction endonuclease McrA
MEAIDYCVSSGMDVVILDSITHEWENHLDYLSSLTGNSFTNWNKEAGRNSLSRQTSQFWKIVFQELGSIECIYTGKQLSLENKNFSLDHFIPYSFVSHDLIWNLYPIEKSENARKSNLLPSVETHFKAFYGLQNVAFQIVKTKDSHNKFLEDYLPISPDLKELKYDSLLNTVQPLITIASNNGFQFY